MKSQWPEMLKTAINGSFNNKYFKSLLKVLFAIALLPLTIGSFGQTLGTYPDATVIAGQNTTVTPGAAPTNTTSVVAYTKTNFSGLLTVNPTTGVVTITDAMQAGIFPVTVKAFGSVNTTTTFNLTVTNPACSQGLFLGNTEVSVGNSPRKVAVADFNGDGRQDIVTANTSSLSIRLGNGTGGFTGTTEVAVSVPQEVAIGDFNGDGRQDIVVVSPSNSSHKVSIFLGNGSGGFTGPFWTIVGTRFNNVAVGDFNGDGRQDLALVNYWTNTVSICLGDGTGSFVVTTEVGVGPEPQDVVVGDFNDDGLQDIATANSRNNTASIRLGDGLGGFSGTTSIPVGTKPQSMAIGDFNSDGNQDFVTANYGSSTVSLRLGDGAGGFSLTTNIGVVTGATEVVVGDFNGDGNQDVATVIPENDKVAIRLGNGAGGFSGTTNLSVGADPSGIAIGDFNDDGKLDIAAPNRGFYSNFSNTVSILLGGAAEINLQGNSVDIADGDNIPSMADHTDFGTVTGVGNEIVRTFTIQNIGTTD